MLWLVRRLDEKKEVGGDGPEELGKWAAAKGGKWKKFAIDFFFWGAQWSAGYPEIRQLSCGGVGLEIF
jgi:hypothetical protein